MVYCIINKSDLSGKNGSLERLKQTITDKKQMNMSGRMCWK